MLSKSIYTVPLVAIYIYVCIYIYIYGLPEPTAQLVLEEKLYIDIYST